MAAPKSIITIGKTRPGEGQADLEAKLNAGAKKALEAGYDLEMVILDIANFTSEKDKVEERFRSKHWDGVIVGFGVRGNPDYTEIFETLVNMASEIVPGVQFGFTSTPEDLFPCLQRVFGQAK